MRAVGWWEVVSTPAGSPDRPHHCAVATQVPTCKGCQAANHPHEASSVPTSGVAMGCRAASNVSAVELHILSPAGTVSTVGWFAQ